MGYGDDLLITAFAAKEKNKYPDRQIVIGNVKKNNATHSIIYDNNPNISNCEKLDKNKKIHLIDYHQLNRPYIDYNNSTNKKYVWNYNYRAVPGELYFTNDEIKKAKNITSKAIEYWKNLNPNKDIQGIIFLETNSTKIKHKNFSIKHLNKSWGLNNWEDLVNNLKTKYLFINSAHEFSLKIQGTYTPAITDFRTACSIMKHCDLYVGPEGGFSHVAGALNKKAVVYYGGWITPNVIGYNFHTNLYFEHPESPCGLYREICKHCEIARKTITVEKFQKSIEKYFS